MEALMRAVAASALVLLSISRAASAACPPPDAEVSAAIEQISQPNKSAEEPLELLLEKPMAAACQLIAELKLVDELRVGGLEQEEHPAAMRVVWSIRALRYITGCGDFRGSTKERFAMERMLPRYDTLGPREQFLMRDSRDKVPFFAVWMSHDSTFFAARDAQAQIIAQWRGWLNEVDNFEFDRCEDSIEWYF
jgi:hypothetical protein